MKVPDSLEFLQTTIQSSTVLLRGFPGGRVVKNLLANVGDSTDLGLILWVGKIHSSILAREIPWTEEPGRLHIVHGVTKSQTGRHDGVTEHTHIHTQSCYGKLLGHLLEMQKKQREALRCVLFHRELQQRETIMMVVIQDSCRPMSEIYKRKKEQKLGGR